MRPAQTPLSDPTICEAMSACFAAGDSIKAVAKVLGTNDMRVRRMLAAGRSETSPPSIKRVAESYDGNQARIIRNREALALVSGINVEARNA